MRFCKGICTRYKGQRIDLSWYKAGVKRCDTCQIFIKFDGLNCPCCGAKLSTRAKKSSKNKKRY